VETIIASSISAGVTLLVCIINNRSQHDKTRALLDYRLGELEHKVDKHNKVIERTFRLEGRMNEAEHDIRDLKGYHKPGV
jgi:hypothetical protein